MPMLQPGEIRAYDFAARPGTHWMHAHIPAHEMMLLAAPLIVRRPEDVAADRQEVTLFLHDFSFKSPAEVLTEITGGASMAGMDHGQPGQGAMDHSGMDMGAMGQGGMMAMPGMDGMAMDLNDYNFDAYLANDRTLDDPEVVQVDKGGQVLVRVINAAAATVFWIDTGALPGRLVAVDGEPVHRCLAVALVSRWASVSTSNWMSEGGRGVSGSRPARGRQGKDGCYPGHAGGRCGEDR